MNEQRYLFWPDSHANLTFLRPQNLWFFFYEVYNFFFYSMGLSSLLEINYATFLVIIFYCLYICASWIFPQVSASKGNISLFLSSVWLSLSIHLFFSSVLQFISMFLQELPFCLPLSISSWGTNFKQCGFHNKSLWLIMSFQLLHAFEASKKLWKSSRLKILQESSGGSMSTKLGLFCIVVIFFIKYSVPLG